MYRFCVQYIKLFQVNKVCCHFGLYKKNIWSNEEKQMQRKK